MKNQKVINALNHRIDFLFGMAESANEIYAERGSGAVSMGYTPENFDFSNQAPNYLRRANKLQERLNILEGFKSSPSVVEQEAWRKQTLEELPF